VLGSWLPYIFAEFFGVAKTVADGMVGVPYNVTLSFYVGAVIFLIAILWTVVTTKEFPPDKEYLKEESAKGGNKGLSQILSDFRRMPATMKQLGLVQFFSWFALFTMWVFTTSAVATHVYGLPADDHTSVAFNEAGNWVSGMFGVYNGVSAVYALFLPVIAAKFGRKLTYSISLAAGGLGLISIYFIHDPNLLVFSMIGVGIAWAGILAMPYAILAGAIPPMKMGIYMGVFNFFITLPQIFSSILGGPIVKYIYQSQPIYSIVMAGVFLLLAAFSVRFVIDREEVTPAP
jgi:maltose/moltooligosaccharide transporter